MNAPARIDVFLDPGDTYFGGRDVRIRTVLGSCVSIVFWHPGRQLGGMCHYMVPGPGRQRHGVLDGRYADDAFALMLLAIGRYGTPAGEYQVKLFGGGDMFPDPGRCNGVQVGRKNVEVARALVQHHGMAIVSEHLEGVGHRCVIFDVGSGEVWVRQLAPVNVDANRSLLPWPV
jgi:chemotaxis protein CheD